MSKQSKLAVLRAKTDRDLLILTQRELDRALTLADVASTKGSPLFAQAQAVYEMVATLLSKSSGFSQADRVRIEAKLKALRYSLDLVPSHLKVQRSAVSFVL